MADLQLLEPGEIDKRIKAMGDHAIENLAENIARLRSEAFIVADALPELARSAKDLMADAIMVEVGEVDDRELTCCPYINDQFARLFFAKPVPKFDGPFRLRLIAIVQRLRKAE
jgi:hypothetical protein